MLVLACEQRCELSASISIKQRCWTAATWPGVPLFYYLRFITVPGCTSTAGRVITSLIACTSGNPFPSAAAGGGWAG